MSQQNSKIQQKPNEKTLYALKNPQIMQKQVKSIPKVNEFPIVKKEDILYGKAKSLTQNETDDLYSYKSAICKIKFKTY